MAPRWGITTPVSKPIYFIQFSLCKNKIRLRVNQVLLHQFTLRRRKMHPKHTSTAVQIIEKIWYIFGSSFSSTASSTRSMSNSFLSVYISMSLFWHEDTTISSIISMANLRRAARKNLTNTKSCGEFEWKIIVNTNSLWLFAYIDRRVERTSVEVTVGVFMKRMFMFRDFQQNEDVI